MHLLIHEDTRNIAVKASSSDLNTKQSHQACIFDKHRRYGFQ